MKKILPLFLILLIFLFPISTLAVSCGDPCSNTDSCSKVVDACSNQSGVLQKQANTIANQIASFNAQIRLGEVKIQQTQDEITLLGGRIDQVQLSLTALTKAFSARAVTTYKMTRVQEPAYFLFSGNIEEAVSKFHYLQEAENSDQNLLTRLQTVQKTYQDSKTQSETLQKQLQGEEDSLNAQKVSKAQLLADTQGSEANYQKLLAQAQAQLASFSAFVNSQGGASILNNQTVCDGWGCYYNQRDSQWGNTLINSQSGYSMAGY